MPDVQRCSWAGGDPLYCAYHDDEWGVPLHDDHRLFEMLILEGFQAGLSWITILRKREAFRTAFDRFDYNKVSRYTETDINRLLSNPGIVRNRLKVSSAVQNAKAFIAVRQEFGSFDAYLWKFTENQTISPKHRVKSFKEIPCRSEISDSLSKDLKKRGFSFVGSVICYSFMQAVGMVDDHLAGCFKVKT